MSLFKQFKLTSLRPEPTNEKRRHSVPDSVIGGRSLLSTILEVYQR